MQKKITLILVAICTIMFSACNEGKLKQQQATIDSLANANNMSAEELQQYVSLMNSISESIDYITAAEGQLNEGAKEGSAQERRARLKEKITNLADVVNQQRKRIEEIEANMKKSGLENSKLMNLIKMMKAQLDDKDAMIAELTQQIENKNIDISRLENHVTELTADNELLTQTVSEQEEILESQTELINEAYVKIGTKRELKDAGILDGGGFLKKAKMNVSSMRSENFKKVDIRTYTEVTLPSENVKILTPMPESSYRLVEGDGTTTLHITDPAAFWSVSNFLVIQTK